MNRYVTKVKITYKNTYWDLVLFNCTHQFLSVRFQALFVIVATLVFLTELGASSGPTYFDATRTALIWYVVVWIGQMLFTALFVFSRKNRSFITEHTLEVTDAALVETTQFNRTESYWFGLNEIVRRPGFFAIYLSKFMAHVVPSSAFSSAEEKQRFFDIVSEKIRAAKQAGDGPHQVSEPIAKA